MSQQSIKQTIDLNVYQNGQQRITGVVMNSVLKEMVDNEYSELTELASKIGDLDTEHRGILSLIASLFDDVVFTRDRSADVTRLKSMVQGRTFAIGLPFPMRLL